MRSFVNLRVKTGFSVTKIGALRVSGRHLCLCCLFLGIVFLAGCVSLGPTYHAPSPPIPDAWLTPTGDTSGSLADWWRVFDDPWLTQLVVDVGLRNRDLEAAAARLDVYAASYRIVGADLLPMVNAQAGTQWERETERVRFNQPLPGNPGWLYQVGFTMSWELDVWGKVRRGMESARGHWQASQEDVRHLTIILQAQAASEYILLRTVQQRLVFAERNVDLQRDTLDLVRERHAAELTGALDVHQAEMNLAATKASIPPLRAQIGRALNALCLLTGRLPGELDELLASHPVPETTERPGILPANLLRQRPDIRAAERELAARTAEIGVARADLFPMLELNGGFAWVATDGGDLFSGDAQKYQVGPALRWPLFNAGKVRNRIRAAEAAVQVSLARYEQIVLGAYRECEDALAAQANELSRLAALREAVEAAEKSVELAHSLYLSGLTNFQNVLDMQRQLATYQDAMAQSMGDSAIGLVAVYKAFGGGWASE